jgi:hypothetical protein
MSSRFKLVRVLLLLLFMLQWSFARESSLGQTHHPLHCCFTGLAGVATVPAPISQPALSRLATRV